MKASNDHLSHTLSSKRLASHELLLPQACQCVEDGGDKQDDSGGDKATGVGENAQPLNQAHYAIDSGSHVVSRETTDEGIEFGRCRTDPKEKWNLDKQNHKG